MATKTKGRTLEVQAVKPSKPGHGIQWGLRQHWLEGSDDGVTFDLAAGAGLGSPYLILTVERDGKTVREAIDVRTLVEPWVDAIVEEMS